MYSQMQNWDQNFSLNAARQEVYAEPCYINGWPRVAEWLRPLILSALNHLSSQPCGFEPNSGHVSQAKFCLQVVFLGDVPFSPHLLIDSAQNEWNNLDGP